MGRHCGQLAVTLGSWLSLWAAGCPFGRLLSQGFVRNSKGLAEWLELPEGRPSAEAGLGPRSDVPRRLVWAPGATCPGPRVVR